ncbi:MAG: beta-glucosidase [Gammaproteobacteria bacterium]|nr:beta-glucosidase [Gammaproteobacteria bacterium]
MKFGKNFVWGAATSSYQIEGAAYRDGGGLSVWDMLGRQAGKIANGDTGEVACDHYQRFEDDVALMAKIGLQAYRFSISWPRVLPEGTGKVNQQGLDFYSRLVDALLENNITPWITLFHWDFPYALYCRGGWLNRDSADWFADYTRVIVDKLSDRVSHWVTLNEPQCFIGMGHQDGAHAPGMKMGFSEVLLAGHNALRAHGKSVQVIRANAENGSVVGAAQASKISLPVSERAEDIEAARQHMFCVRKKHVFNNAWFSDPMILGHYPEEGVELFAGDMPEHVAADMECINQELDFFGANIYSGDHVRASADKDFETVTKTDLAETAMGWPITPEALYWGPKFFHERYRLPVAVTESGMANDDRVQDGKVHDRERIDFLYRYLTEYARAIEEGVPVLGYFLWSVMDNFEWAEGYGKRFGIVYVDYETQQRIPKYSAYWYKALIASHVSGSVDNVNVTTTVNAEETLDFG